MMDAHDPGESNQTVPADAVVEEAQAHENEHTLLPKPRSSAWRVLGLIFILLLALASGILIFSLLSVGPATMPQVLEVMPGVPIFPYADVAPGNRAAQHGMAVPLLLTRMQGAERAETALLYAPADDFFVADWYRRAAPAQRWTVAGEDRQHGSTRLIFLRGDEGLQVFIGATRELVTPVQLVYLQGMTPSQQRQLRVSPVSD